MLIDWFTVAAQALNFIILVWLLKRYLYKPILNAVDAREKRIAAELADAAAKKAEAEKERDEFQCKNKALDQQRVALLSKATQEATAERQKLLDEARKMADDLSAKRAQTLRNDADNLNQAILERTQCEVFAIARKALTDLAGASLEERMCAVFVERLQAMDAGAKTILLKTLSNATEPALVRSAFDLPPAQRAAIEKTIHETFSTEIALKFQTDRGVIGGIELTANGQKVAWSIADYLVELQKGVSDLLVKKDPPPSKAESPPDAKPKDLPKATPLPNEIRAKRQNA